ncbi:hypothetical protein [Xanthomonas euroxanthea]|uniref:hypothetical protein n=1 Tax=Xanthomonas euroxanthea TaxID=2259622 RepID=UPI0016198D02|nr:hypothetical protein [Xanthomonas euroxanthea]
MPGHTIVASGAFLRPVGPCLHVLLLIHPAKDAGQNAFRPLSSGMQTSLRANSG